MKILENNVKEKNFTKIQLTITLILILFFCVTGATYAYFAVSATNNIITGNAATVNLTLDVTKIFPAAGNNTGVMVPQLSVSGSDTSPLATALKNGCVDGNSNIVCQVYRINIQNIGGTAKQIVDGKVLFYGNTAMTNDVTTTMPNLKWKLIDSVDTTTLSNSELGTETDKVADAAGDDNVFANDVTMTTGSNFTYYMIIWINETTFDQPTDVGKSFYAKIAFDSSNGTGVTSTFIS